MGWLVSWMVSWMISWMVSWMVSWLVGLVGCCQLKEPQILFVSFGSDTTISSLVKQMISNICCSCFVFAPWFGMTILMSACVSVSSFRPMDLAWGRAQQLACILYESLRGKKITLSLYWNSHFHWGGHWSHWSRVKMAVWWNYAIQTWMLNIFIFPSLP